MIGDILFGGVANHPRHRHLLALGYSLESLVQLRRECDRCAGCWVWRFHSFCPMPFQSVHRQLRFVCTTLHHFGAPAYADFGQGQKQPESGLSTGCRSLPSSFVEGSISGRNPIAMRLARIQTAQGWSMGAIAGERSSPTRKREGLPGRASSLPGNSRSSERYRASADRDHALLLHGRIAFSH